MKMMHPAWHATAEESSRGDGSAVRIPIGPARHTRAYAAVLGILAVLAGGFLLVEDLPSLVAQFSNPSIRTTPPAGTITIRITSFGLQPQSVAARPGQEIVWSNETQLPHILESETLRDASGALLYTPAIFPNSTYHFTIASDQEAGKHMYASTTDQNVNGEVTIVAEQGAATSVSGTPSLMAQQLTGQPGTQIPAGPATRSTAQLQAQIPADTGTDNAQDELIPTNPYTVGGNRQHPFDAAGNPIESLFPQDTVGGFGTAAPLAAQTTRRPAMQPATGPELGLLIVSLISVASLAIVTRRYFA
jgi:plastocyanin